MELIRTLTLSLALLVSLFLPYFSAASVPLFGHNEAYSELRDLVQDHLFEACMPIESYYLTLGQSPTPILAFLEGAGLTAVGDLPLTYAGYIERAMDVPEVKQAVFAHLDRFAPSPQKLAGRKLCVIDLMISGNSLSVVKRLLKDYYAERFEGFPAPRITTVGLDERLGTEPNVFLPDHLIALTSFRELPVLMNRGVFESVSPHGSYYPIGVLPPEQTPKAPASLTSPPVEPRREYVEFRLQLYKHMQEDPDVERYGCALFLIP